MPLGQAHPRSRGENARIGPRRPVGLGSSPLTRGKRLYAHGRVLGTGLIPAHAGKTTWLGWIGTGMWAHPRSRGENSVEKIDKGVRQGSSPLTRGKHKMPSVSHVQTGLIPAHAGKTGTRAAW